MKPRIGISLGDVTGIGPEVTLKSISALAQDPAGADFTVFGNARVLEQCADKLRPAPDIAGAFHIVDPCPEEHAQGLLNLAAGAAPAARAAVAWIREGAQRCLAGELDALVTAPVNKHAIVRAGIPFTGHTELLSEIAGEPHPVMMLLGPDERQRWLRVALATIHIALRDVPLQLNRDGVLLSIQRAARACADLGLERARVGVCGLNPHAGEGGDFGDEESLIIEPAVEEARQQGLDVHGPLSGDTVFHQALHGDYDAVVAMYHDQGLAPLKLAAFNTGVNWTLGLPFIRTSPDHGTAYDIAGQGKGDPSSMISAIRLAIRLAARRHSPTA
jgi:4-hydroxythreonine-4-phosphate dehydrogenase